MFNPNVIAIVKMFAGLLMVWHWMACAFWYIATIEYFEISGESSFYDDSLSDTVAELLDLNLWLPARELFSEAYESSRYVTSLFWAIMATTGTGRDIRPSTSLEYSYSIVMMILGLSLYAFIVGGFTSALSNFDSEARRRREKVKAIKMYLNSRSVPNELQQRIFQYYDHMFHSKHSMGGHKTILHDLHETLRLEILIFMHRRVIEKVSLFRNIKSTDCIIEIIEKLEPVLLVPDEIIIEQGGIADAMYIVVDGKVEVWVRHGERGAARFHHCPGIWVRVW